MALAVIIFLKSLQPKEKENELKTIQNSCFFLKLVLLLYLY